LSYFEKFRKSTNFALSLAILQGEMNKLLDNCSKGNLKDKKGKTTQEIV
jgi:hypothetical protein